MPLQTRLADLVAAIGADIKGLKMERTLRATTPPTPPAGESTAWTTDGKSLNMIAPDGVVTRIGPAVGEGSAGPTGINATLTPTGGTTETVVASWALPANFLANGSLCSILMAAQVTGTANVTVRVRIGPLGTTADPLALQWATSGAGGANQHLILDAQLAMTSATQAWASGRAGLNNATIAALAGAFAPATVDPTVPLRVSVTIVLSAANPVWSPRYAVLDKIV